MGSSNRMKKSSAKFNMTSWHIRKRIPQFQVPAYEGKRYDDLVPATLDIQERIALASNGLTGPTDSEKDYLLYFRVNFRSTPPSMSHGPSDICQAKFMEALPLLRLASGSNGNDQVDPVWMATALRTIGPDGLIYWPSLPWARYPDWCEPCPQGKSHYAVPWACGRMIGAMTTYLLRDPKGPWEKEIRKVVHGLAAKAAEVDDYAYFPQGGFAPDSQPVEKAAMPKGIWASMVGWTIHGLAQYHRISHYQPAIDLAGKLSRYLAYHGQYFGPEGQFLPNWPGEGEKEDGWAQDEQGFNPGPPPVSNLIHFQHHMVPLLGMLDHALAVGDTTLAQFVQKSFEWARRQGNEIVGYFPENLNNSQELETSELCEVAGMIGLALKLSAGGLGDYWDLADRWIRNQFAEGQLTQSDWIYHMAEGGMVYSKTRIPPSAFTLDSIGAQTDRMDPEPLGGMSTLSDTHDHVPERNLGAFAGWPTANDWFVGHGSGIMHCCTGNAARALYYIWEHMLTFDRGTLSVNLLLNRPSKWVDVHSHIPYIGQVDVRVKRSLQSLRVRLPEWITPKQIICTLNGRKHKLMFDGRYAVVGAVRAKDKVTLMFPISERKVRVNIQCQHYHLTLRGNDVVDIYPRGRFCPLYQRSHYRQNATLYKNVCRFVSDETIYW